MTEKSEQLVFYEAYIKKITYLNNTKTIHFEVMSFYIIDEQQLGSYIFYMSSVALPYRNKSQIRPPGSCYKD